MKENYENNKENYIKNHGNPDGCPDFHDFS